MHQMWQKLKKTFFSTLWLCLSMVHFRWHWEENEKHIFPQMKLHHSFLLSHVNTNTGRLDWELNNLSRMGSWLPLLKLFHFQNCWQTTKQLSRPAAHPATPAVHSPRCHIYMQNYGATASFFRFYWEIISEARHSAACESAVQYSALELMKSV